MNVRTKIAVTFVLSTVMVAKAFRDQWPFLYWGFQAVPFLWMVGLGKYSMALKYFTVFAFVQGIRLPYFYAIHNYLPSLFYMLVTILRNMLPGFGMALILFKTTSVSEYLNAMSRMKIPVVFSLATSVVFRFIPTIREEYAGIRSALHMRGLKGLKTLRHPAQSFNYRFMPLLNCCSRIGDELSMASLCRGLSTNTPRTIREEDQLHKADLCILLLSAFVLCLWVLTIFSPNLFRGGAL